MSKAKQLVQALVLGGIMGVSVTANAGLISTQNFNVNGYATVSDTDSSPATSYNNDASLGTATVAQFSVSTGVLTGVSVNLNALQTQSTTVSSTSGSAPNNGSVTSSGTGSSVVQVSANGFSQSFGQLDKIGDCTNNKRSSCAGTAATAQQTTTLSNASVSSSSFGNYAGSGTTQIDFKATMLSAFQSSDVFGGTETTMSEVKWVGTGNVAYEYLLHALGSFNGTTPQASLTIDFGTVFQGDTDPARSFSVFNLANANRVALDLDSVSGSGDTSALSTNFLSMFNLGQGGSTGFSAFLDTANLGSFNAVYTFNLSDADVGVASTRLNSSLTLNLTGTVAARAAAVPEPFSLALLGIGILGIAANRRRKG